MSSKTLILSTLFLLSAVIAVRSQSCPNVHEILDVYGLPQGLLPETAGKYSITNGEFKVELETDSCFVHNRLTILRYEKTVSGKISLGKLEDVKGIVLMQSLPWDFPMGITVTQIVRDEQTINLHLGTSIPPVMPLYVGFFKEIPKCADKLIKGSGVSGREEHEVSVAVA